MPTRDPQVTAANVRKSGKDQGRIVVSYRNTRGGTTDAVVAGVATQLTAVTGGAVTPQGAVGTTTYRYRIAPVDAEGGEGVAIAAVVTSTGNAVLDATNFNRISWNAKTGAVAYKVYGRSGADGVLGLLATVTGTQYDDTGAATPGATVPAFTTDALRLKLGPGRYKNNVKKATGPRQTNVYFLR